MLFFANGVSIYQQPVRQAGVTDGDTPEIDDIRMNPLVGEPGHTVAIADDVVLDIGMAPRSNQLPSTGFAIEIDGRNKTEFDTREALKAAPSR